MLHNNTIFDVVILAMIATVGSAGVSLLVAVWIGSGQCSAIIITKVGSPNVTLNCVVCIQRGTGAIN